MATPNKTNATMSSRLATMKFMQRAAASPVSSPDTAPNQRSAKRQRLSNGSFQSSPMATPGSHAEAIQQALAAEERKRQEAVDREAARRGETKWVLDIKTPQRSQPPQMRIVSTSYAALDSNATHHSEDDDDDDQISVPQAGRRRFGTFPAKAKTSNQDEADSDAESDNTDHDESGDDPESQHGKSKASVPSEVGDAIRARRDAQRRKNRSQALQQAEDRRSKQFNLNKPTSISSGGAGRGRNSAAITCHRCGKSGHIQAQCPLKRK